MEKYLHEDLTKSFWIDGLQRQVKLRKSAISEIMDWCNVLQFEDNDNKIGRDEMIDLIKYIDQVVFSEYDQLSQNDHDFLIHVNENLLYTDDHENHLPIPVYSLIRPNNPVQFINHILLSMGRFDSEIELTMQCSIQECFAKAKIIGNKICRDKIEEYLKQLFKNTSANKLDIFPPA